MLARADEPLDLGTVRERRVLVAKAGQGRKVLVEHVAGVEAVERPRGPAKNPFGRVLLDLRREQILPGVLVAAPTHESLLVAVVRHRLAPGQVHQRHRQLVARQQIRVIVTRTHEKGTHPTHVVIAEERRQRVRVGVGIEVEVVTGKEVVQPLGARPRHEIDSRGLEPEVERRGEPTRRCVCRHRGRRRVVDLAEEEEPVIASGPGVLEDGRGEALPKLHVDVFDGVDPEAVNPDVHPRVVDVDHPVDDRRVLGKEIVEAGEVAVRARLPGEG